ncbi:single-stranded DNA-binding protein [Microbacterium amylolyticum]|uniref:Single-stranded DNA-binding protein n=1 Tax=Microbacterium amylolyticum TaxID=936337 RepID=A0ABS4ZFF0_9MICO|nr:single-stranded DNA-binding protein [Microbacterium amylolyticum]MBP2435728.1 single-strand DNA-binding protein [Microbacterium amylolyticum]
MFLQAVFGGRTRRLVATRGHLMPESITIVGNIATDPVQRQTKSGDAVIAFRVLTSNRRRDAETGNWYEESVNAYSVSAFKKLAEHSAASLRKGQRVVVAGSLKMRDWEAGERSGTDAEVTADAIGLDLRFAPIVTAPAASREAVASLVPTVAPGETSPGYEHQTSAATDVSEPQVTSEGGDWSAREPGQEAFVPDEVPY